VNGSVTSISLTKKEAICSIPKVIFRPEYQGIIDLNLSKNSIVELEARLFLSLPQLRILNISCNRLKYISGKIEACSKLTCLLVDKNEL